MGHREHEAALADAEGTQGHLYSISPVAHADGMFHGAERGKRLFKLPDLFAVDVPAAVQHVGGGLEQGVAPAAERRAGVGKTSLRRRLGASLTENIRAAPLGNDPEWGRR